MEQYTVKKLKKIGINSIKEKVGILANRTLIYYWYCDHFECWKIVDFANIQKTRWANVDAQYLFATLKISKLRFDKKLAKNTLFEVKNTKKAIQIINDLIKKLKDKK